MTESTSPSGTSEPAGPPPAPEHLESLDPVESFWDEEFDEAPEPLLPRRQHFVTTVIVAHDGAVWLPAVLTTLAGQTRPTDSVFGVDNASTDTSIELLQESLGRDRVVGNSTNVGFGAAVEQAVALGSRSVDQQLADSQAQDVIQWLWLLHDDSAPDLSCLERLLDAADNQPSAVVVGPKVLGWHDRRLLLEVGVSVNADGRRVTGLERREHDQGQHDGDRDVLAVSSAGMLIRRDVWEALGGFDPNLPLFRDDVDFCWRVHRFGGRVIVATDAIIHHREASAHGRRHSDVRPHSADREAAARVLLAHASPVAVPFVALRLFLGSTIRSLIYLIGKDIRAAREELSALLAVALRPGRIVASRRLIARTSSEPTSVTRALRPNTVDQLREVAEATAGLVTTSSSTSPASISALDSGPIDDDAAFLDDDSAGLLRRTLAKPSVLMTLILVVVAVISTRILWFGEGVLQGGALLPAPDGASDVWSSYIRAWHDVGPGSTAPAAPYLIVVALMSTVLFGNADWAMSFLVLLAVPLAGWSAYFTARGMVASKIVRAWMGATYALLPAMTGAVEQGRIGTLITAVALPFAIRSMVRLSRETGTIRRAGGTALLMTVILAATPAVWIVGLFAAIAMTVIAWRTKGSAAVPVITRFAIAIMTPLVALMPWTFHLLTHPSLFLLEPGLDVPGIVDPNLRPLDVFLLHPGGPGMNPLVITSGLVFASFLALFRRDTMAAVTAWWGLGLTAVIVGVFQTLVLVTPPGGLVQVRPWPGPMTLIVGLAMIAACGIAVEGLRERFVGQSFSLAQPLSAIAVIGALVAPFLAAAWWIPGTDDVVIRAPRSNVPAFVAAEANGPQAPRTLILFDNGEGVVSYTLLGGAALMLGDAETPPPASVWAPIDGFVAALASGRGGGEVNALRSYGVRYIKLAAGSARSIVPSLDSEPGVRRLASADGEVLWRIGGVTSRAQVWDVDPSSERFLPTSLDVFDPGTLTTDPYLDQALPPAVDEEPGSRVLWVGASADSGWRASIDGQSLSRAKLDEPFDWSASFEVPAAQSTAQVDVVFDDTSRQRWLILQAIVLIALIIVALPERRMVDPDPDDVEEESADAAGESVVIRA